MAESYNNPNQKPDDPKNKKPTPAGKPAPAKSGLTAEAQRRAQSMAKAQPTSPQQFFQEAWVELKKTSWPNRDVLTKSTSVVLALVLAVAVWVGVIDATLTKLSAPLFNGHH